MNFANDVLKNGKVIPFKDLAEVNFEEIDIHDKETDKIKWRQKFSFVANELRFECYARTEVECKIWVQTFCRIIDFNNGISPEVSGVKSQHYEL